MIKQKKIYIPALAIALIIILYCGFWLWLKSALTDYHRQTITAYNNDDIFIESTGFKVSGFPFAPIWEDHLRIETPDAQVEIPHFAIKSFFIPGQDIHIRLKDIDIRARGARDAIYVDHISLDAKIPDPLPQSFYKEDIAHWQAQAGRLDITMMDIKWGQIRIAGPGTVYLDNNLQPEALLNLNIAGFKEILALLVQADTISEKTAGFGSMILDQMAVTTDAGQRVVPANIIIKDQTLTIGPLKLLTIPEILWSSETLGQPALRQ